MKVLYIEDNAMARKLVHRILEKVGYIVISGETAKEGLNLVSDNSDIDLVLLDMNLPDMRDMETLVETVNKIRDGLPRENDLPILAITAYSYTLPDVIEAGCNDLIKKPITSTAFLRRISAYQATE